MDPLSFDLTVKRAPECFINQGKLLGYGLEPRPEPRLKKQPLKETKMQVAENMLSVNRIS